MMPLRCIVALPGRASGEMEFTCVDSPAAARAAAPAVWSERGDDVHLLPGGGLIVGRLFSRGDNQALRMAQIAAAAPMDSADLAAWLTANVWGAWLAVLPAPGGGWLVARDPGMLLPFYERVVDRHVLLASDLALFEAAGDEPPHVDWRALGDHLRFFEMRRWRTCLEGIDEVPPGLLARAGTGEVVASLWTPWAFCDPPVLPDRRAAADALRKEVIGCVAAWAGQDGRLAVSASGGLDSSIVCAALAAQDIPFACITVATADPSGDESGWVRMLTDALGVRMVVRRFDPASVALDVPVSRGLARPVRRTFMAQLHRLLGEACSELGVDTVFDGNGGDNLFCYLHSAAPVADRLWREGPGRGAFATFLDTCRLTDCDAGVMARALLRRMAGPVGAVWTGDDRLLSADARAHPLPVELTPWIDRMPRRRPGKARHIALIQRAQNFTHGLTGWRTPMRFSPLMSQPLIERALGVPTWEWCAGGINRALAREAFRFDLPAAIIERRSKAGPDSMLRIVFRDNRARLRDMLLGGLLAMNGLLDAQAVEQALRTDEQADDPAINRLFELAEAEAWARSWQG